VYRTSPAGSSSGVRPFNPIRLSRRKTPPHFAHWISCADEMHISASAAKSRCVGHRHCADKILNGREQRRGHTQRVDAQSQQKRHKNPDRLPSHHRRSPGPLRMMGPHRSYVLSPAGFPEGYGPDAVALRQGCAMRSLRRSIASKASESDRFVRILKKITRLWPKGRRRLSRFALAPDHRPDFHFVAQILASGPLRRARRTRPTPHWRGRNSSAPLIIG